MPVRTLPWRSRRLWLSVAVVGSLGFGTASTQAQPRAAHTVLSEKRVLPYPVDQVWGTAVRYLRVDRDYTIVDRDREAGYIVFEIPLGGERKGRGTLEAMPTTDAAGRSSTAMQISTQSGPTHLPFTLLSGVATKLRAEHGQAPAPPKPPAPKPPQNDDEDDRDGGAPPRMPPAVDPDELSRLD